VSTLSFEPVEIAIDEDENENEDEAADDAAPAAAPQDENLPALDATVMLVGRRYHVGEPSTGDVLALLAFIAKIARRASKSLVKEFKALGAAPSGQDIIGRVLEQVADNPQDMALLTGLVVFGTSAAVRDERDAVCRQMIEQPDLIKLAPLTRGLMLRLAQSDDLRDALGNAGYVLNVEATKRQLQRQQLRVKAA